MTSSSTGKRHSMKFNSLPRECFLECQAVTDFGSVLVHRDKYRALFPTTNSSVHLMVPRLAEPDGREAQTADSSRQCHLWDETMQHVVNEPRSHYARLLPVWLCLYIFHHE